MNMIFCGFYNDDLHPVLYNILDKLDVEKCYINWDKKKYPIPSDINPIFFNEPTVNQFATYPIEDPKLIPIDQEILEKMFHCEVNVLKMMDRISYVNKLDTYNERKRLYLKHVQFWNHVLLMDKIELVIFSCIPHDIYDYILLSLCEIYYIPRIIFLQLQIGESFIFIDSIKEQCLDIKDLYKKNLEIYKNYEIDQIPLEPRFLNQYNLQTNKDIEPHPFYTRKKSKIEWVKYYWKKFISGGIKFKPIWILKKRILNYQLFHKYEKLSVIPDFNKKYIYLALHYQPELTTSPLAGVFVDQLLIVKILSYCAPKDVLIYVKEHPGQKLLGRYNSFYEEIIKFSNVRLMSRTENTFELIKNASAIATATGTVGWESLFRNKPILLFGNVFYQYANGVYKINTIEDCKKAMHYIYDENKYPKLKDIRIFLKTLEMISIEGIINYGYMHLSKLSNEQNIDIITSSLFQKISEIKDRS